VINYAKTETKDIFLKNIISTSKAKNPPYKNYINSFRKELSALCATKGFLNIATAMLLQKKLNELMGMALICIISEEMNGKIKKVLITVKAYPNPSTRYGETVCVAGIDIDKKEWVRLYPVPSYRDWQKKYKTKELLLDKIKERWLDRICSTKNDIYFFVGNLKRFRDTFMVLGVFYPPIEV